MNFIQKGGGKREDIKKNMKVSSHKNFFRR